MGGPGSGRRKGGSVKNTKGQAAAAKRVMVKRMQNGANNSNVHAWKKGLVKRHPNLKGQI